MPNTFVDSMARLKVIKVHQRDRVGTRLVDGSVVRCVVYEYYIKIWIVLLIDRLQACANPALLIFGPDDDGGFFHSLSRAAIGTGNGGNCSGR